jgi:penicillin-binding protein 1A
MSIFYKIISTVFKFIVGLFTTPVLAKYVKSKFLLWPLRLCLYTVYYFVALQFNFLWMFGYLPSVRDVEHPEVSIATELYTADSVLLGKYYNENRTPVKFDKISPYAVDALIATEDVRFYKHNGMDFQSLFGSMAATATGDERGGSTITQQLVKNIYNTRQKTNMGLLQHIPYVRTVVAKTKEWLTAFKLESFYTKEEILEMYFNTVDFGNNSFGIKVASQNFFSKQPADLKLEEAATLVGLLKATTSYNPIRSKKRAKERRNVVLSQMLKYSYINKNVYDSVSQLPMKLNLRKRMSSDNDSYLRQFVERTIKDWCEKKGYNMYEDGLKIYTTINSRLQQHAEDAMHSHLKKLQKSFNEHWKGRNPWRDDEGAEIPNFLNDQITKTPYYAELLAAYNGNVDSINIELNRRKQMKLFDWNGYKDTTMSSIDSLRYYAKILNMGMMSLDPFSGEIRAYIGGIDYNFFKYDHVTQGRRQAGSTFKPFAYLAALADSFTPCDRFIDKPVQIKYEGGQIWEPKNSDNTFTYRSKSLRRALAQSCNSITAQITDSIGWGKVIEYAHKAGIISHLDSVPAVCLGASDVSVYEMVRAYSTFLNKGKRSDPIIVSRIYNSDGELIGDFKCHQEQTIDEEVAWLMCYMLLGALQEPGGTSRALWGYDIFPKNNEIAGKTGTTSNYSDAWYMGMTRDLVTGVWVGADFRSVHFRGGDGQGSRAALPVFAKMLEAAYKDPKAGLVPGPFPKPWTKIKRTYICPVEPDSTEFDYLFSDSLYIEMPFDSIDIVLENDSVAKAVKEVFD